DSYIPPEKYALVHEAVLKACDVLDGVKDGVIENPTVCHFDPKVLVCKGADGPNCLTPAQAEPARSLYAPVKNPKTGAEVMPALLQPGSALCWAILAGPEPIRYSTETFQSLLFSAANWHWHRFTPATDSELEPSTHKGSRQLT